jgi:hexosaminidase
VAVNNPNSKLGGVNPIAAVVPAPVRASPADGAFAFDAATVVVAPGSAAEVGADLADRLGLAWATPDHDGPAVRLEIDTGLAARAFKPGLAARAFKSGLAARAFKPGLAARAFKPGSPRAGDEGYALAVRPDGIRVVAASPAGLCQGVATLRQLRGSTDRVPSGEIVDWPRYAYRGVMLDVARHFFAVPDVLRLIDLAALFKLNHLHLHLTDDQGWRIAIDSWPRLATYGGGTEVGDGPGGYYTKADYATIVAHAAGQGITVVPEVDVPGHTNAALASYPVLSADGVAPERYRGIEVGFSSLAVGMPATERFLDDVFGELAALTPGPYLHVGGDEVKTIEPAEYAAVVLQAQQAVARHGKVPIGWHEIAAGPLLPSTVVQYWGAAHQDQGMGAAAAAGNRIIMSPADRAYLDMKYDENSPYGLAWAGFIPTRAAGDWNPDTYLSDVDSSAVLGVEAALWTETLQTYEQAEAMLMPRLAVLAEVGWSGPRDWADLRQRLAVQAPLWTALGVAYHRDAGIDWPAGPASYPVQPGRDLGDSVAHIAMSA